ncbi:hypothetical protein [Nocardioides halotolerans]|uniref:hypothetical protein n=1 Tax=Nocardioides halotolerans TaxID=433660 RepID=UPI0004030D93|nr:hypothetical protein [Nocardioides halotolerans]
MTTIDHRTSDTRSASAAQAEQLAEVISLADYKDRRRLERLTSVREHLATTAAAQRSHGLEEAAETFELLLSVESIISQEFPLPYEHLLTDWAVQDSVAEHPVGEWMPDCTLCRTISRTVPTAGPPDAA